MHSEVGNVEASPARDYPSQEEDHRDQRVWRRGVFRNLLEGLIQRINVQWIQFRNNLKQDPVLMSDKLIKEKLKEGNPP